MTILRLPVAAVLMSAAAYAAVLAGDFKLPTPAPAPSVNPTVPDGEKLYYTPMATIIPGSRTWNQWLDGNLWHWNTTQSVGDGAGMCVSAPAGGRCGTIVSYETGVRPRQDKDGKGIFKAKEGETLHDDLTDYKGLCMWINGDGSTNLGVIGNNDTLSKFRFPLADTNWHKVFMPWEKWDPPIKGYWWFLTYSIQRKDNTRKSWYIVDRVHLYKTESVEPINPTPGLDPPGMVPAKAFVSGREYIPKTLAKLAAKHPVKIVCAGDSLAGGAQLGYTLKDYRSATSDMLKACYWYVLGDRLKTAYGYTNVSQVWRTTHNQGKSWYDVIPALIKTREQEKEHLERPACDLSIVAVAVGGWVTQQGLDHFRQVLDEKPDLVVWEYGSNDGVFGHTNEYAKATREAVDRLQKAGIEVVVHTITPSCDLTLKRPYLPRIYSSLIESQGEMSKIARSIAAEKHCALVDMYAAFTCRGVLYLGDLYSDAYHANHYGHEIMADVLDALLTDRDVTTWNCGPAADMARAARQPARE